MEDLPEASVQQFNFSMASAHESIPAASRCGTSPLTVGIRFWLSSWEFPSGFTIILKGESSPPLSSSISSSGKECVPVGVGFSF